MEKHIDAFIVEISKKHMTYFIWEDLKDNDLTTENIKEILSRKPELVDKRFEIQRFIGSFDQTILKLKDDRFIVRREYRMI